MADADKKIIKLADTQQADSVRKLSIADVLFGLDVVLFSPAPLITHGGFDRDPVKEYHAFAPPDDKEQAPFYVDMPSSARPFFSGLGRTARTAYMPGVDWDRRIYGIDKACSEECFAFIRGIAFRQPDGRLYSSFSHVLTLSVSSGLSDTRRMPVTFFGLYSFCFPGALKPEARVTYLLPVNGVPTAQTKYFLTDDALCAFFAQRGVVMPTTTNSDADE